MILKIVPLVLLLVVAPVVVFAQGGVDSGALSQQTQRAIQTAMDDLYNLSMGAPTAQSLEEQVGKEKLDKFLTGAVVKVRLMPDGTYETLTLEGGEVLSFKLGKSSLTPEADEEYADGWLTRRGNFTIPKKAQKLSMKLKAGPNEVGVDCHNKYEKSEEPVTFYVGPLDGLFCVGLTESSQATDEEAG